MKGWVKYATDGTASFLRFERGFPAAIKDYSSFLPDILRKVESGIGPTPDAALCPIGGAKRERLFLLFIDRLKND